MTNRLQSHVRGAGTFTAIAAALALAACNPPGSVDRSQSASLPALPATLPLAAGGGTTPAKAPGAALLPAARPIPTVRLADPRDSYAYADDAWGFADALGDAPPDYGFYYDDVQPWAWQGYDDSIQFVEPLGDGYRYYYYRPGADAPYFVRDPDYGYGYDNGRLAVVYGSGGTIIPYDDYGPRIEYASRYYARGRDLYQASRQRRPVIAANWAARQNAIVDTQRWAAERASQRAWQDYHQRTEAQQAQHWREEQARRRADTVRFTAWQGQDFRTPPPPRAIPAAWTRANWAQDQRRFAPPAAGFNGDAAARERAAAQERERVARAAQEAGRQTPGAIAGPAMQRQQPQPQEQQRLDFARQQAERAQQARVLADQQQRQQQDAARQQREQALHQQQQAQASQQAAARDAQARARQQADRTAGEQARQQQAQARERAQTQQRAQADLQQRRQEQARQGQLAQQRQAAEAQQRAQQARTQEQAARAQQRQAAQVQQRPQMQEQMQRRQATQAQQRAQMQAQAEQRQAAQAQQRAEAQARQRPVSPPPQIHAAPAPRPAAPPVAPRVNPGNGGDHKREPH